MMQRLSFLTFRIAFYALTQTPKNEANTNTKIFSQGVCEIVPLTEKNYFKLGIWEFSILL